MGVLGEIQIDIDIILISIELYFMWRCAKIKKHYKEVFSPMDKLSLPPNEKNIGLLRKFAHEKGFNLSKVRNKDAWNLTDKQSGQLILRHESLLVIHDYLCHCDD